MALGKTKKVEGQQQDYKVSILRATQFESGSVGFDMEVNGIRIYNCIAKTVKSKKTGEEVDLIDFPSYKGKNGDYYNYVWFNISFELRDEIIKKINDRLSE